MTSSMEIIKRKSLLKKQASIYYFRDAMKSLRNAFKFFCQSIALEIQAWGE